MISRRKELFVIREANSRMLELELEQLDAEINSLDCRQL